MRHYSGSRQNGLSVCRNHIYVLLIIVGKASYIKIYFSWKVTKCPYQKLLTKKWESAELKWLKRNFCVLYTINIIFHLLYNKFLLNFANFVMKIVEKNCFRLETKIKWEKETVRIYQIRDLLHFARRYIYTKLKTVLERKSKI